LINEKNLYQPILANVGFQPYCLTGFLDLPGLSCFSSFCFLLLFFAFTPLLPLRSQKKGNYVATKIAQKPKKTSMPGKQKKTLKYKKI
jgi:hypothetical protein